MSNSQQILRAYCAGPLFNQAERVEMTEIADALCAAGYQVYLPHRDGMEFRLVLHVLEQRGWPAATAAHFLHAAIFALDIYQLVEECDCVVWNLNGRTPDEGAVSEAAIAWTLGKPLIAYKDDVRSLITGRDNPLLAGLVNFETVQTVEAILPALERAIAESRGHVHDLKTLPLLVQRAVGQGSLLWSAMCDQSAVGDNSALADVVTDLFGPGEVPASVSHARAVV